MPKYNNNKPSARLFLSSSATTLPQAPSRCHLVSGSAGVESSVTRHPAPRTKSWNFLLGYCRNSWKTCCNEIQIQYRLMPQLSADKLQPVRSKGSWRCLSQYAFLVKFVIFLFMMAYFWFHTIPNTIPHLDQDPKTPFNVEFRSSSPFNGSRVTHDGMAPMMAGTDAHPAGVDPGGADWIGACRKGTIPAVYPNSSEARTAHMQTVLARIGGCGRLVQAVMRDHVTTRTTPDHRKQALYGTDVIFNALDTAIPQGNLLNAATHFRMVNELANTKASTAESTWTLFLEDDAQLHADVASLYVSAVLHDDSTL
jgi:hypothetical protein